MRVKKNIRPIPLVAAKPKKRDVRARTIAINLRKLIAARLNGPPIIDPVKPLSGRIQPQYQNLADQIAAALLDAAREGSPDALRVLVEYSEGTVMRLSALHYLVDRIYQVVSEVPGVDESILYHVGKSLHKLKEYSQNHNSGRAQPPPYPGTHALEYGYSEDPQKEAKLAPRKNFHKTNPHPISTYAKTII